MPDDLYLQVRVKVSIESESYSITYQKVEGLQEHKYDHIGDHNMRNLPTVTVSNHISVNPCAYDALFTILRNIGKQAGI